MIRNPLFNERHASHSPAYWREELIRLRNLFTEIDQYGGIDRLRTDIGYLERELGTKDGLHVWVRPSILNESTVNEAL